MTTPSATLEALMAAIEAAPLLEPRMIVVAETIASLYAENARLKAEVARLQADTLALEALDRRRCQRIAALRSQVPTHR